MINQFGVVVDGLSMSQLGIMISKNLNYIVEQYNNICPTVFFDEFHQSIITPLFPMMQQVEFWNYNYPVISTNLETTKHLINAQRPPKKLFYVVDLEWLYFPKIVYDELEQIYNNENIELIARSESHYKLISTCWKEPIGIIEDFYYKDILKLLGY